MDQIKTGTSFADALIKSLKASAAATEKAAPKEKETNKTGDTEEMIRPRYSGILMHPTSLPSPYGIGDLGQSAYDFVDYLEKAGQSLWQVLPLGPTGYGDSPYQSFSSFAGQPLLISPDELIAIGLLEAEDVEDIPDFKEYAVDYGPVITYKTALLHKAHENFMNCQDIDIAKSFNRFLKENKSWLKDYALFMAIKDFNKGVSWHDWPLEHQFLDAATERKLLSELRESVSYYQFIQWCFFTQWTELKAYANRKGIKIVGDIPIFVSPDSADVWANKDLFQLDTKGYPTAVAGVPPDYFSETGQLWGNPLYKWEAHKETGYAWWISRVKGQLKLVDFLRIDHFRGFEAYWRVPYGDKTAIGGKWIKGPGTDLFDAIQAALGDDLPIFAEDLGVITPEVEALRDHYDFPGMKILQFAFDGGESVYLPYMYGENCICYTGTHDNDTTVGWFLSAKEKTRKKIRAYTGSECLEVHWDMIRLAMSSTARYAIFPMQDVLGYGGDCRMNVPSKASGNWCWRATKEAMTDRSAKRLKEMAEVYGRDLARMLPKPLKAELKETKEALTKEALDKEAGEALVKKADEK